MRDGKSGGAAPVWLRLAWAELKGAKAFTLTFTLNLALGLTGFLAVDGLRASVTKHLEGRSKVVLAADLGVSALRPYSPEEKRDALAALPAGTLMREETSLYSMVRAAASPQSRLVEVRAVDGAFPYYGAPELKRGGVLAPGGAQALEDAPVAWVYPEVMAQLGLTFGDKIVVGQAEFTVEDVVEQDPSVSSVGLAMAPKIFIGHRYAEATGLLAYGSRVYRALLFKLPPAVADADARVEADNLDRYAKSLKAVFVASQKAEARVKTHRTASAESSRLLTYLGDYLSLIGIVALLLAGVGELYLFRSFLARRSKDIAILLSLGSSPRRTAGIYLAQLVALGAAAAALALALAGLLLPLLPRILGAVAPDGLTPHLGASSVVVGLTTGVVGSILFCLPSLARLGSIKPAALFREDAAPQIDFSSRRLGLYAPLLLATWGLAVTEARSLKVGSLFVVVMLVSGGAFAALGAGLTRVANHAHRWRNVVLRSAALALARRRASTIASFLALGLSAMLVTVVPLVRALLAAEFDRPAGEAAPSLFLFDIQAEQMTPLAELAKKRGLRLEHPSPMIRGRLQSLNGKPLETSGAEMEGGGDERNDDRETPRARTLNLSYRDGLTSSESLVAGAPFEVARQQDPTGVFLSLEEGFADRNHVHLGDILGFDIQGVTVEGKVVNLRHVRWASFQPNFFVEFSPGALDDAPKTFVAALPALPREERAAVQGEVVRAFPNVAMIDVELATQRILDLVAQIARTIAFMAFVALVAGAAVLYAIAGERAAERQRDVALLKTLGGTFRAITAMMVLEFALLGAAASLVGAVFGVAASYAVGLVVFEGLFAFVPAIPLAVVFAVTLLTSTIGFLAVRKSLATPAARLLAQGAR